MTSGPKARACRPSVLASGPLFPPPRVNWRYTRFARTSHSRIWKLQFRRCFNTSIRKTTSAGVPNRPRGRLFGCPPPRASDSRSPSCASSRTWSTLRIQSCHMSAMGSARKPSARLRGRLRALIMALAGALRGFRAQGALVQLANGLQCLLQLVVVFEPPPDLEQLVSLQADLTVLAAGIVDTEDPLGMTDAAGTLGAAAGMEGSAMKEGPAHDTREGRQSCEKAVDLGRLCHLYR